MTFKHLEDKHKYQREYNRKAQSRNREFVVDYKKDKPCVDCGGYFHYAAMDFDHTSDNKSFSVARVGPVSIDRLLIEIAKCDLVCANCHRVRTFNRRTSGINGNTVVS